MNPPSRDEKTLDVAVRTTAILAQLGIETALIGALAVHGYPRATGDADLATDIDPFSQLRDVTRALRAAGFNADLNTPDAEDSLGGVITITGEDFNDVQIVNFYNPLRPGAVNPGADAIRHAAPHTIAGGPLRVVDLPQLIALKLYAGGFKSQLDVVELLARNPKADRKAIREVCARFDLQEAFDKLQDQLPGRS